MREILRRSLAFCAAGAMLCGLGCQASYPKVKGPAVQNVTLPSAMGSYRRVYNTSYHVVNKYGVVRHASFRYGVIEAELAQDNAFFDKTRKVIQARIFDAGEYWDVECRVLVEVEDSEVVAFPDQFAPRYNWMTIDGDQFLEVRLNNEIRQLLTEGAFEAKQPLTPNAPSAAPPPPAATPTREPATPAPRAKTCSETGPATRTF